MVFSSVAPLLSHIKLTPGDVTFVAPDEAQRVVWRDPPAISRVCPGCGAPSSIHGCDYCGRSA